MKKFLFISAFLCCIVSTSYAQNAPFKEGDIVEIVIGSETIEGVIHQVGASGRCEVKYGNNGFIVD